MSKNKKLSEADEKCLNSFIDEEAGFFSRRRAKSLLSSRPEAKDYVKFAHELRADLQTRTVPDIKLENAVLMRIEEEEKLALYLGERRFEKRGRTWPSLSLPPMGPAIKGGSFAAAMVALFMVFPYFSGDSARNNQVGSSGFPAGSAVAPLFLRESGSSADFVSYDRQPSRIPRMEVDWMRSGEGRVSLIQEPGGQSAIIWVKRKELGAMLEPAEESDSIRILEQRVPSTISAFDK